MERWSEDTFKRKCSIQFRNWKSELEEISQVGAGDEPHVVDMLELPTLPPAPENFMRFMISYATDIVDWAENEALITRSNGTVLQFSRVSCLIGGSRFYGYGIDSTIKAASAIAKRDLMVRVLYSVKPWLTIPHVITLMTQLSFPICQISKREMDKVVKQSLIWSEMMSFYEEVETLVMPELPQNSLMTKLSRQWDFVSGMWPSESIDQFDSYFDERLNTHMVTEKKHEKLREDWFIKFSNLRKQCLEDYYGGL